MKIFFSASDGTIPSYVTDQVEDNRRTYTTPARVNVHYQTTCYHMLLFTKFQKASAIFTATKNVDETYDAYERDIAIVSFYFKQPTAFEYTR